MSKCGWICLTIVIIFMCFYGAINHLLCSYDNFSMRIQSIKISEQAINLEFGK